MTKTLKEIWDNRYSIDEFAYGEAPNNYLKEQIQNLETGKILFPAEGEGRNAVYAAILGWDVYAYDISSEGRKKALTLADKNGVRINYQVGELHEIDFKVEQFDAVALIFAHFPVSIKEQIHKSLDRRLRKGGTIIFEAFSKNNLQYVAKDERIGGPRDVDMLFTVDEVRKYFPDYEIIELKETETTLNEGLFHNGTGSVIRFVGKKK